MSLRKRRVTQYQPWCDPCAGNVGAWISDRKAALRILAAHDVTHERLERVGLSIRAVDYLRPGVWQ